MPLKARAIIRDGALSVLFGMTLKPLCGNLGERLSFAACNNN